MSSAYANNTLYVKNETLKNLTAERDYSELVNIAKTAIATSASYYLPGAGSMYFGYKALYSALDLKNDFQQPTISYKDVAIDTLKTAAWTSATILSGPSILFKDHFVKLPGVSHAHKLVNKIFEKTNLSSADVTKAHEKIEDAKGYFEYYANYFPKDAWISGLVATNSIYNSAIEAHAYEEAIEHLALTGDHNFVVEA